MTAQLVTPNQAEDSVLVRQFLESGDERAFTTLFKRHASHVAHVVYRVMGNDMDLDDIVQETFLAAAAKMPSLLDASRLRPWLTAIALRKMRRRFGERGRRRKLLERHVAETPQTTAVSQPEEVRSLYRALDEVPAKYRIPWILHRLEEHSLPEVAELCEVSLATVKRRVAETEKRLERRIGA